MNSLFAPTLLSTVMLPPCMMKRNSCLKSSHIMRGFRNPSPTTLAIHVLFACKSRIPLPESQPHELAAVSQLLFRLTLGDSIRQKVD
jgi:hypothetical protein